MFKKSDGIYTFNTLKNEWNKIIEYDANYNQCYGGSAAYDQDSQLLYISGNGKLSQFELKNNDFVSVSTSSINGLIGSVLCTKLIYIEQQQ